MITEGKIRAINKLQIPFQFIVQVKTKILNFLFLKAVMVTTELLGKYWNIYSNGTMVNTLLSRP